jgi:hypothetical protein
VVWVSIVDNFFHISFIAMKGKKRACQSLDLWAHRQKDNRILMIANPHLPALNFLPRALLLTLLLGAMLTFGGWHNTADAAALSAADRNTLNKIIKVNCIEATQEDRKNHNQVYLWDVEDYCECCASASSQVLSPEELSYFETNRTWPEEVMERNRNIGFKCMGQVTSKP